MAFGPAATYTPKLTIQANDSIVVEGTSITIGVGQGSWYAPLQTAVTANYGGSAPTWTNKGVSGNKVTDLIARLQTDVIALNPTVVIFEGGVNDLIAGIDLVTFAASCATLIANCKAGLPSARIGWAGIMCYGEYYLTDPIQATVDSYVKAISDACIAGGVTFFNVRPRHQLFMARLNAAGAINSVLTNDTGPQLGIHPNSTYGIPMWSSVALARMTLT